MASNLSSQCEKFESSAPVQITQIILLSVILVLSLVGNSLIIIVVYKRPELRKTMNYFIVNMAVSDFVFPFITLPKTLHDTAAGLGFWEWPGIYSTPGKVLCKVFTFATSVSLTVSIESLAWIAFNRFVAVVWPIRVRRISPRFRAFAIASTWIVAVVINCLDLYYFGLIKRYDGKMACLADSSSLLFTIYIYLRVVVIYIAPMFLVTILYSVIAVTLRRRDKVLQCSTTQRNDVKKRQAIKMSFCVVVSFYLFFLPLVMAVIFSMTPVSKLCSFFHHFYLFSSSALYLSSTTNPIICFMFVESFRRALRDVFNFCLCKCFRTRTTEPENGEQIILKRIKVVSGIRREENLGFNQN